MFQIFYSAANGFSKFYDVLSDSRTDVVLVFIDVILLVAISVDVRNIVGAGTNKFLICQN